MTLRARIGGSAANDGDFLACPRSGHGISRFNTGKLLAEGNSNKDVANRLNLSLHTVETHRWRIMEKMDMHSTADLVLSAVRRGMVT